MGSMASKWPWPKLCRFYRRSMYDKLISSLIESRRCLKPGYIGTMAQFCLSIATNYVKTVSERQPPFLLFFTSEEIERLSEHSLVQEYRWRTLKEVGPAKSECFTIAVFYKVFLTESWVVVKGSNYSPPCRHLIVSSVFEKRKVHLHLWFGTDKSSDFLNLF